MRKEILTKPLQTYADYEMLIEKIYIEMRSTAAYLGKEYKSLIGYEKSDAKNGKNVGFTKKADTKNFQKIAAEEIEYFQTFVEKIIKDLGDRNPEIVKHFYELHNDLKYFETLLKNPEAESEIESFQSVTDNLELYKPAQELKCETFIRKRLEDLKDHLLAHDDIDVLVLENYLNRTLENLKYYKDHLAQDLFGKDSVEVNVAGKNNLAENRKFIRISEPAKFDKRKTEIRDEIGLVDVSINFFKGLSGNFEEFIKSGSASQQFVYSYEHNLKKWEDAIADYKKESVKLLIEKGLFLDFVVRGVENLTVASYNEWILAEKLSEKFKEKKSKDEEKQEDNSRLAQARIELKKSLNLNEYYREKLISYIENCLDICKSDPKKLDSTKMFSKKIIDNIQNMPEYLIFKPGDKKCVKHLDSFKSFLESVFEKSLQDIGLVNFLNKWFEDFEEIFKETENFGETVPGNLINIELRLSTLIKLSTDKIFLEELKKIDKTEDIEKIIGSLKSIINYSLQGLNLEELGLEIKKLGLLEETFKSIRGQIREAKNKFDSFAQAIDLKSKVMPVLAGTQSKIDERQQDNNLISALSEKKLDVVNPDELMSSSTNYEVGSSIAAPSASGLEPSVIFETGAVSSTVLQENKHQVEQKITSSEVPASPKNTSTLIPNSIQTPQNSTLVPSLEKGKTDSDPILSTPLQTNAALADGNFEILGNPPQHVTTLDQNSDIIKKDDLVNHGQESASSSTVNQNIVTNQEAPSSGVTNSEVGNLGSTNSENVKKPWFRRFVDWIGNHISSGLARILNKFLNNFSEELPKKLPDFAKPDVTTHNTNITKQSLDK